MLRSRRAAMQANHARRSFANGPLREANAVNFARPQALLIQRGGSWAFIMPA